MIRELNNATEQVRTNVAEMADKAREISNKMKDQWSDTYRDVEKSVRRVQVASERGLDEARHRIKDKQITSVATVGIVAFSIGLFAGLVLGRKSKD
jgi:ElaB/YqjD/DUF883 family membrane-anchored ribosome-binding protein